LLPKSGNSSNTNSRITHQLSLVISPDTALPIPPTRFPSPPIISLTGICGAAGNCWAGGGEVIGTAEALLCFPELPVEAEDGGGAGCLKAPPSPPRILPRLPIKPSRVKGRAAGGAGGAAAGGGEE